MFGGSEKVEPVEVLKDTSLFDHKDPSPQFENAVSRHGVEVDPAGTANHGRGRYRSGMPVAPLAGIDLWYEAFGEPDDPPLLLITGLNSQAIVWSDEFCQGLVDRGFRVIRFDNRDVGLSTKFTEIVDVMALALAVAAGQAVQAPYLLADMAGDAIGLLDHLGIEAAHVVGVSMGGMIAQQLAIDHPTKVRTLTSIMSSTGQMDVGQPAPEAFVLLTAPPPLDREGVAARAEAWSALVGSPEHRDPDRVREVAYAQFDRCFLPAAAARHLAAVVASPDRASGLAGLELPTLVLHGSEDKLVAPSGGERTAELVPGADFHLLEGMGHDLPVYFWSRVIELITRHAANAASGY